MKCILCPKETKKPSEFIYGGNSYCWDCYYIRRDEVIKLQADYELEKKRIDKLLKK